MTNPPPPWPVERLKDVAAINASSLPAGTPGDYELDYVDISNVNYFGMVDAAAVPRLRFEEAPSRARRRVRANTTIISSVRPNLQAAAFFATPGADLVCSTGFNTVEADASRLTPRFAYYTLISEGARQHFEAHATGVGYPAIGDRAFEVVAVRLPPKGEQDRIAAFLDASCTVIDRALATKTDQIAVLGTTLRSSIERAVTGATSGVPLRSAPRDWLKTVPAHWNVVQIKRVLKAMDYGISVATSPEGRFPVLKMGHLQAGELVMDKIDFVDEVDSSLLLQPGDVLFNRTNSKDQVGKAAIFRGEEADGVTFASYLVRVRANHRILPEFLNYAVNCDGFLAFARCLAIPSVAQSNLNSTRYAQLVVPLPPLDEQAAIVRDLDDLRARVASVSKVLGEQRDVLDSLRKSLIHECVTGIRRVSQEDLNRVLHHAVLPS